tara:strand:+ start:6090 stop:6389 length:300 start_codon:yes stop_codon:yes gene_type:complete
MTNYVHRNNDARACGARTKATSPNVRVNGEFISTEGNTNTHGGGALRATETAGKVRANGIPIILLNDPASADSLCPTAGGAHCAPKASSASPNVRAGSG